eukprot:c26968_g1_i1 orf=498-3647(-)
MAGNEWINSYLEAILAVGSSGVEDQRSIIPAPIAEKGVFNPTKYFVEEVITGFDESDIYRSWLKATATRNAHERNTRLENMCWRIWHLARRKKQIEWDDAQRLAKRRIERERGRRDAAEDMSEDLSEGDRLDGVGIAEGASMGNRMHRVSSVDTVAAWAELHKDKRLYIVLISMHGLVRGENMELGRDSDTGGQVKYVVELARALAMMPQVYRVDLLTRQISSPEVDWSYAEPTEMLTPRYYQVEEQEAGESSGAYIVRIPCGPRDQYIRKELLWPYIEEFVDGSLAHILNMSKVLGEQIGRGELVWPHVIHGHYADAGDVASLLSSALNVPMVFTGHSLGRNKLEQLLKQGRQSKEDINATYKIMRRIEAEELSLDASELIITSTRQEIDEQWGLYDGFDVKLERILRARARQGVSCHGRFIPRMVVIPPGMEFSDVEQDAGDALENEVDANGEASSPQDDPPIWDAITRFFKNSRKPMILALARPDPKKNITTLVKAFGECRPLRDLANLTLVMGNRADIDGMPGGNAAVLTTILKLIDKYDLYGQVAYPKHHKQSEVPDIYRLAARTKGVFVNPALVEPFGLTLIEAAAYGLPIVATRNGGPVDIHRVLNNGLLIDPHHQKAIADALLRLVADKTLWNECRMSGLRNIHLFSWPEHCKTYLSRIALCRMRHPQWRSDDLLEADSDSQEDSLRDVQDLKLPFEGERGSLDDSGDLDIQVNTVTHGTDIRDQTNMTESVVRTYSNSNLHRAPIIRRRKLLVVIAVDCYDIVEDQGSGLIGIISNIFKAFNLDAATRGAGFILSTALTLAEVLQTLSSSGIRPCEFDAFICSSGSQLYYPSVSNIEDGINISDTQVCLDLDYEAHIDYRWGREDLKKTISRWMATKDGKAGCSVFEDEKRCNTHCIAYEVKDRNMYLKVDEFRERLRMQALRSHAIYCQNESKLHVLPLLASRSQALRYLFVRWGVDVANMVVFVGETGDTDREQLLLGMHKTVILKGAVKGGSERLLRSSGNYQSEDVIPPHSPYTLSTENGYSTEEIIKAARIVRQV